MGLALVQENNAIARPYRKKKAVEDVIKDLCRKLGDDEDQIVEALFKRTSRDAELHRAALRLPVRKFLECGRRLDKHVRQTQAAETQQKVQAIVSRVRMGVLDSFVLACGKKLGDATGQEVRAEAESFGKTAAGLAAIAQRVNFDERVRDALSEDEARELLCA